MTGDLVPGLSFRDAANIPRLYKLGEPAREEEALAEVVQLFSEYARRILNGEGERLARARAELLPLADQAAAERDRLWNEWRSLDKMLSDVNAMGRHYGPDALVRDSAVYDPGTGRDSTSHLSDRWHVARTRQHLQPDNIALWHLRKKGVDACERGRCVPGIRTWLQAEQGLHATLESLDGQHTTVSVEHADHARTVALITAALRAEAMRRFSAADYPAEEETRTPEAESGLPSWAVVLPPPLERRAAEPGTLRASPRLLPAANPLAKWKRLADFIERVVGTGTESGQAAEAPRLWALIEQNDAAVKFCEDRGITLDSLNALQPSTWTGVRKAGLERRAELERGRR
ncbi:MAG TPA: hypothetical protein VGB53_01595 [Rubricoccaceae bacterium]|jgi:hypothetical protein